MSDVAIFPRVFGVCSLPHSNQEYLIKSSFSMSCDDIIEIQQLVCREREARDRHWWDEMYAVYHPEAQIKISWYNGKPDGFIHGSKQMAQKAATIHRLRPIAVRVDKDKAVATLSAAIESRLLLDGVEADLDSQARLIYKAEKGQEGWKLASLDCIYQRDTLTPAVPGEQLKLDLGRLRGYRSSYRCLSYVLEYKGYGVDQDLPGDDRPDQVEAIYGEVFSWLKSA